MSYTCKFLICFFVVVVLISITSFLVIGSSLINWFSSNEEELQTILNSDFGSDLIGVFFIMFGILLGILMYGFVMVDWHLVCMIRKLHLMENKK